MAASGKKSADWTNRDNEKLLDVLIEQRAQGAVKFEWSLVKRYGGKYKSFQKKVPANLDKMKFAFHGKQATWEMSFAPGMVTSPTNQTQRSKGKAIDVVEHVGDSDETNEDGSNDNVECLRAEESRSKRKSEGRTSSDGKRQALLNWSVREEEVNQALAFLHMREEAKMDEDECTMDKEDCTMDEVEDQAIDTIISYTLERYLVDRPRSTFKERMPRAIGGESGAQYIHRLLSRNRPDLCRKVLRLEKEAFTHPVSTFIERGLLEEGHFVKTAEIVAMTLFILARGASYRDAEDRFQ
ncbi:hypothetical protein Cgig2_017065 [Carnegiea gigantea]|uniref:DUF8040 domain-containing protein n=1 Tax=Carnegiea gigantea TaxID=171969 RepID=A0A9Q1Q774_9CARY|nr:hypothetical protein Cgig2_017065 [Carnegiea gigantea]